VTGLTVVLFDRNTPRRYAALALDESRAAVVRMLSGRSPRSGAHAQPLLSVDQGNLPPVLGRVRSFAADRTLRFRQEDTEITETRFFPPLPPFPPVQIPVSDLVSVNARQ